MAANKEFFAWITKRVDNLQSLLRDPQEGLSSWCLMYGKEVEAISDYWQHGFEFAAAKYDGKIMEQQPKIGSGKTEVQTLNISSPFRSTGR